MFYLKCIPIITFYQTKFVLGYSIDLQKKNYERTITFANELH